MEHTNTHGELLVKTRNGDREAWDALVEQMSPLIWSITRNFRLDHATAKDVAQTVWMRLIENRDRIVDPDRLPGWIATTCRREAMDALRRQRRAIPSDLSFDVEDTGSSVEQVVLDGEDHREVMTAFATLDESDQELLRLLTIEPALSYQEISEVTGRPVGSLGPTRARALDRLRKAMEGQLTAVGAGS
ncbi:MAG TPA: sigma-70 family RNA polymerase sigma factor [Acidimicrobiia bacterium]